MTDTVIEIGGARLQHGKHNDRVYLMHLAPEADVVATLDQVTALAEKEGYSKVFAKVPERAGDALSTRGYVIEARAPMFYQNGDGVLFASRFLDGERARDKRQDEAEQVLEAALVRQGTPPADASNDNTTDLELRLADGADAPDLARLYGIVFKSYPFPIDDPGFLREGMAADTAFYGAWLDGQLVAASSAEMVPADANAEMTDFATLPESRGHAIAYRLLRVMEQDCAARGIRLGYTIARAYSHGMNITFARAGYAFGGRLVNNTNIGGGFESMNIWWKKLRE